MKRRLFTLLAVCTLTARAAPGPHPATLADIRHWIATQGRSVLTFLGYSGAEYESHAAMLAAAATVLASHDPAKVLVNIGATPDGVGSVYGLARQRGFVTMGIVSSRALQYGANWSAFVDKVFVIEDSTWGGADKRGALNPTSAAMVAVSDEMVAIGGGDIARDEFLAGRRAGKRTLFIPAEMNHALARAKAERAGLPAPEDFAGPLGSVPRN